MTSKLLRLVTVVSIAILGMLVGVIITGTVDAAPPPDGPGAPVIVQNVDDDGYIKVHEQGTVPVVGSVDVGNFPTAVSVDNFPNDIAVNNLPENQNVTVTNFPETGGSVSVESDRATTSFRWRGSLSHGQQKHIDIPLMYVSFISVEGWGNEVVVDFWDPDEWDLPVLHSPFLQIGKHGVDLDFKQVTFPQRLPVHRMRVYCTNSVLSCNNVTIFVFGD